MSRLVLTTLFFGMSLPDGRDVSEQAWQSFVADSLALQFREGFTVLEARGQWLNKEQRVIQEASRVVMQVHSANADADRKVQAVVDDYRRRFEQESVLRVDSPVCGRF